MAKLLVPTILAVTFLVLAVPIQAHHSITALWFTDRSIPITGLVRSYGQEELERNLD